MRLAVASALALCYGAHRMNAKAFPTVESLIEQKAQLIAYLLSKIQAEDWHAVMDSAADLREIDAKLELLNG